LSQLRDLLAKLKRILSRHKNSEDAKLQTIVALVNPNGDDGGIAFFDLIAEPRL
jgi:hypothetical protein